MPVTPPRLRVPTRRRALTPSPTLTRLLAERLAPSRRRPRMTPARPARLASASRASPPGSATFGGPGLGAGRGGRVRGRPLSLLLAKHEVHHPAAPYVRPVAPAVREDVG